MPFYKAYGLTISSEIELPELTPAKKTAEIDLEIIKGEVILPKLKKAPIHRRGIRALFGQDEDGNLILHWEGVADFKAVEGEKLIVSAHTNDKNLLSLFVVSEALAMILFQKGYFLLHASAVKIGHEAWCFMGNPGAGKSTTAAAFIKAGCTLLSDDLTAIKFDDNGKAYIIPGYPQLKIWDNTVNGLSYDRSVLEPVSEGVNKFSYKPEGEFSQEAVPVSDIFFLHKANNRPALQALKPSEIPIETLKNFPLPIAFLKKKLMESHFTQSFLCAKSSGMWRKRRPAGFSKLEKWVDESIALSTDSIEYVP
jgi:hypothetical protein